MKSWKKPVLMLKITEHFEYYNNDHLSVLQKIDKWEELYIDEKISESIFFDAKGNDMPCISISLGKEDSSYHCIISSNYFIGLDRLPLFNLPVYVAPKVNTENNRLNYIEMLFDALTEPENFNHMEGLVLTKFQDNWIEVENETELLLSPFLIAQFLTVVKNLVKKPTRQQEQKNSRRLPYDSGSRKNRMFFYAGMVLIKMIQQLILLMRMDTMIFHVRNCPQIK